MREMQSIIKNPHEYKLIFFGYYIDEDDNDHSYIDLFLKKDDITRKLRFMNPTQFTAELGFPHPTGGMEIIDISENHWEGINVQVRDFEANNGSYSFYAKSIIDLESQN